ncbi:hypothetical protein ACLB2K_021386 [Fragaria x ananassa]
MASIKEENNLHHGAPSEGLERANGPPEVVAEVTGGRLQSQRDRFCETTEHRVGNDSDDGSADVADCCGSSQQADHFKCVHAVFGYI